MDDNLFRDPAQWLITDHPNRDRRAKNDREERKERRPPPSPPPPTPSLFRVFVRDCFAERSGSAYPFHFAARRARKTEKEGKKKRGRRRRRQVPRGRGLPTGKKEGRKLHVGEEARTKVSCPRFLSPMLSLHKVPTPRRHPESTRQTDNQPSNLPLTASWLTHCPPRFV